MERCHLLIGLCVIHLCCALAAYPGFEYDPRLIPQAAPAYYQPQPNPYAQYPSPYQYPGQSYYPSQQPGYPNEMYGEMNDAFIQEEEQATAGATGAATAGVATTTNTNTASVQTPTQTSSSDSTGSSSQSTSTMDALDIQLAAALEAVKTDMVSKGKEVLEEKQWTDDVKSIITQYTTKISNVYGNIAKLKVDMGTLYRKKQQIINAQIQKSLTAKLADSKSDLSTVQAALDKVTNTQMEFEQSKKDIQATINSIFAQLAELKGEPATTGGAGASGGATGSSDSSDSSNSNSQSSSDSTDSSFTEDPDSEIADKTAEINSKIDTIKSIVSALNGTPNSS